MTGTADVDHQSRDELLHAFLSSWIAMSAAAVALFLALMALAGPWVIAANPLDQASISLLDAELPPAWLDGGLWKYPLGTDNQGRDLLGLILYGLRASLSIGLTSTVLATLAGAAVGLIAGYFGGWLDAALMRLVDLQLSFPAILIALLIDGISHAVLPSSWHEHAIFFVLVAAIAGSQWVLIARAVRSITLVEQKREYIQAAQMMGAHAFAILVRHILPNAMSVVLVIMTLNLAVSVLLEATLSFLGVGLPPTTPSLGTLVRIGNDYLFSGTWWITLFPGLTLVLVILSVNLLGDWLRDALPGKS